MGWPTPRRCSPSRPRRPAQPAPLTTALHARRAPLPPRRGAPYAKSVTHSSTRWLRRSRRPSAERNRNRRVSCRMTWTTGAAPRSLASRRCMRRGTDGPMCSNPSPGAPWRSPTPCSSSSSTTAGVGCLRSATGSPTRRERAAWTRRTTTCSPPKRAWRASWRLPRGTCRSTTGSTSGAW